ncbi:hypothetical protein CPB85DRAFT_579122 [Mucidula mucida]|nr:hypothetical protein CPB85DRAFT_579122 [Mucidula mucida]
MVSSAGSVSSIIDIYTCLEGSSSHYSLYTPPSPETKDRVRRTNSTTSTRRPLPPPPVPGSSAPRPTSSSGIRRLPVRPLPSRPSIAVTPATPLPLTPLPSSPESVEKPGRATRGQLTLVISPDALLPPRCHSDSTICTPITPLGPQAPTPTTARRKRMSKLRRHLGETVPEDLIPGSDPLFLPVLPSELLKQIAQESTDDLEICFDGDGFEFLEAGQDEDEPEKVDKVEQFVWSKDQEMKYSSVPPKRYSKRWIVERGGQRWEDTDYSDILSRLRAL